MAIAMWLAGSIAAYCLVAGIVTGVSDKFFGVNPDSKKADLAIFLAVFWPITLVGIIPWCLGFTLVAAIKHITQYTAERRRRAFEQWDQQED